MKTPNKYLIAVTAMLGTLMEVIDTSVANVALPHMAGTYSAGVDEVTWVITSYLVANAVVLPITGFLGNYFGRKRFFLSCLVLFSIASFGSGAAPTLWFLIVMRVIQGFAGGAMVPMSQAILLESFPKEEHGKAMALFSVGVIFGPIIGPALGGWITDNWTWPWIFFINIPLGLVALVLGYLFIEDPSYIKRPEGRVDYWSFLFIAMGLGSLEVMLNRGDRYDWFHSNFIKTFAVLAALGIALFLWRSFTAESPLVDLSIMKNREYATGTTLMFLLGFGLYGSFVALPLFAQNLMGYTATWAGLVLSPGGIASLVAVFFVGNLMGKIDTRLMVTVGVVLNIVSMALLVSVDLHVSFSYLMWTRCLQGFGMGCLFVPVAVSSYSRIPPEKTGQATGLFNLLRNEGGSVGIALTTTVLSHRSQFHQERLVEHLTPFDPAYRDTLAQTAHGLFATAGLDPTTMKQLSLGLLYGQVQRQAAVMAFVDVFWMLMLIFAAILPLIFLLRGKTGGQAAGIH